METDFYVILFVDSLDEYLTFGTRISQTMQVVSELPQELIAGPNPGFVEFKFEKRNLENINFRVPIQQYNESSKGLSGEDLFRKYYTSP